jgi:hypothetical protein
VREDVPIDGRSSEIARGGSRSGNAGEGKVIMNAYKWIARTGAVALLTAGFLGAPRAAKADGVDSLRMMKLLADARTMAVQAKDDAATIEDFAQLDIKWEAHAGAVAKMREHVMAMNEVATELKAAEGTAEPWEQGVIERIEPYMTALAADNEAIMDEFDAHPSLFGARASSAYLEANADAATHLSALIVNFVENGTLRQVIQDYDETEDSCSLMGIAHLAYGLES